MLEHAVRTSFADAQGGDERGPGDAGDWQIPAMMGAGHRSVPRTTRFEAWAPNRDQCLAEAVLAMIEGFADTTLATGIAETQIWIEPADDDDQLARLLDEVIHRLHADSVLPIDLEVSEPQGGGLDVRLVVAPLRDVHLTGPLPEGILLPEVSMRRLGGRWHATFAMAV